MYSLTGASNPSAQRGPKNVGKQSFRWMHHQILLQDVLPQTLGTLRASAMLLTSREPTFQKMAAKCNPNAMPKRQRKYAQISLDCNKRSFSSHSAEKVPSNKGTTVDQRSRDFTVAMIASKSQVFDSCKDVLPTCHVTRLCNDPAGCMSANLSPKKGRSNWKNSQAYRTVVPTRRMSMLCGGPIFPLQKHDSVCQS